MNSPVISVVMTVYNGEPYLREAVESILNQTFTDFEFIIVDDASTDDTWQILNNYTDPRIRLLRNSENMRVSRSANRGIALARGRYIARQDADDVSLPDRFSKQVAFFQEHPDIGFVGSSYCLIDSAGQELHPVQLPSDPETVTQTLFEWNCTCNGSIMFQRRFLENTGLYRIQFDPSEDYDLLLRIAEQHGGANLPDCLYLLRFHPDSLSVAGLARQVSRARLARSLSQARCRSGSENIDLETLDAGTLDRLYPPEPRLLALRHLNYAYLSYLAGDVEAARLQFSNALQADGSLITDQGALHSWLLGHSHMVADRLSLSSRQAGLDFLRTLLASEQHPSEPLHRLQRSVEAEFHIAAAFERHALQDRTAVRQHLAAALRLDLSWLHNRGVLSIGWQALTGIRIKKAKRRMSAYLERQADPDNPIRRVYLMAPEFGAIDGVAEQVVTLAAELAHRGIDTWVFVRRPCAPDNQYLRRLVDCGVPLVSPPRLLAFLGCMDWAARDRVLQRVVGLISPLLLLPAAVDAVLRRRPLRRSWRGAIGYLNRVLGRVLLPDYLDRVFHLQLTWYVWRHRPDVVEISRSDYVWQVDWFWRHNVPTVFKQHEATKDRTMDQMTSLRRAACLIAVSDSVGSALCQAVGSQGEVFVVPNAVDLSACRPVSASPVPLPEMDAGPIVACVSRLSSEKGVQFLPEIAKRVIDEIPGTYFLVAGDGPLRQHLEQECRRLRLDGRFHLLGAIDRGQVLALLRSSDLFLLPSLTEGMPVSVIEAMACRTPMVATAVGGTPELITHGVSGLLVEPGNPTALAQAVIKLLREPGYRNRLGENAFGTYEKGPWTPKTAADAALTVYAYAKSLHTTTRKPVPTMHPGRGRNTAR